MDFMALHTLLRAYLKGTALTADAQGQQMEVTSAWQGQPPDASGLPAFCRLTLQM